MRFKPGSSVESEDMTRPNPSAAGSSLRRADLDPNPFGQFKVWYEQALSAQLAEPTAMTLATATRSGIPSARVVLLKGHDERGFVFYTNYESQKARELEENPQAALVFYWDVLQRQVRIAGTVAKTSREEAEQYFHTRPVASQLGAWASQQSRPLAERTALEQRVEALAKQYANKPVPLPAHWGGFRLTPRMFEFWQGRPNRLHDRFRYEQLAGRQWRIERLFP